MIRFVALALVEWGEFWIVLGSMALQRRLLVAAGSLLISSLCPAGAIALALGIDSDLLKLRGDRQTSHLLLLVL